MPSNRDTAAVADYGRLQQYILVTKKEHDLRPKIGGDSTLKRERIRRRVLLIAGTIPW